MAIDLIDKIKPKNNGSFALVDAADVEMPDGSRLSDWKGGSGGSAGSIPTFDLNGLGMDSIPFNGEEISFETDTTEIMNALDNGAVRFVVSVSYGGISFTGAVVMHDLSQNETIYVCSYATEFIPGKPMILNLRITDSLVVAYVTAFNNVPTSIDLTAFDDEGAILETYADGSTKTTTMEFDSSGNPVKITDGDGNVTTLVW